MDTKPNFKVYHNPRCASSRAGLKYLQQKDIALEVIDYIKKPLTENILNEILLKLNKKPSEIIRTQESIYKTQLKGKNFNESEWIKLIIENQGLIQRPIIVGKYKAVISNSPDIIDQLLK